MLTISINEALAMAPEPWSASEWRADSNAHWTGFEGASDMGAMQTGYPAEWDSQAQPWKCQAGEEAAWSNDMAFQEWSTPSAEQPPDVSVGGAAELEWGLPQPQKLPVDGASSKPSTSWASPMRIPLPDPVGADSSLDTFLELETEIETQLAGEVPAALPGMTLAKAALWPAQEVSAELPRRIEATTPPQLELPPGLYGGLEELRTDQPAAAASLQKPAEVASAEAAMPPGMSIHFTEGCTRVEWQIEDLRARLLANMGRPLVSPPISAMNLPNLRLMVFPDAREVVKNARSSERKKLYENMIKKGPLHGALKLKADCLERATVLSFNLTVGQVRVGPLTFDFSGQAIHGLDDFGIDWLKQVDKSSGSLCVGIEILEFQPQGASS
jgi:hypothetical protein